MELRQLEALAGIADNGTFSRAADALGTVQSNISHRLARLEAELGTALVDRATGALTESGAVVLERARRILGVTPAARLAKSTRERVASNTSASLERRYG